MMIVEPITIGTMTKFYLTARTMDLCEFALGSNLPFADTPLSELSDSLVMRDDEGTVYAIGGFVGNMVWMLCTKAVEEKPIGFLRETRRLLKEALKEVGYLENYVWTGNELHIKWLEWLGAEFGDTTPDGLFQYFKFTKKGA